MSWAPGDEPRLLPRKQYFKFYKDVYRQLDQHPPWVRRSGGDSSADQELDNDDELDALLAKDWEQDVAHDGTAKGLAFAQFSRSLFEVLDQWTDSIDVGAYAALASSLLPISHRCVN